MRKRKDTDYIVYGEIAGVVAVLLICIAILYFTYPKCIVSPINDTSADICKTKETIEIETPKEMRYFLFAPYSPLIGR